MGGPATLSDADMHMPHSPTAFARKYTGRANTNVHCGSHNQARHSGMCLCVYVAAGREAGGHRKQQHISTL